MNLITPCNAEFSKKCDFNKDFLTHQSKKSTNIGNKINNG